MIHIKFVGLVGSSSEGLPIMFKGSKKFLD